MVLCNCGSKMIYLFSFTRKMSQSRNVSSIDIRNRFLEYFTIEKSHTFIRSSPVVPLHDKSLAFVNAGMNQVRFSFHIKLSTVGLYSLSNTVRP